MAHIKWFNQHLRPKSVLWIKRITRVVSTHTKNNTQSMDADSFRLKLQGSKNVWTDWFSYALKLLPHPFCCKVHLCPVDRGMRLSTRQTTPLHCMTVLRLFSKQIWTNWGLAVQNGGHICIFVSGTGLCVKKTNKEVGWSQKSSTPSWWLAFGAIWSTS